MKRNNILTISTSLLAFALLLAIPAAGQQPDEPEPPQVKWSDDWHRVEFTFLGEHCSWPEDIVNGEFPPPGSEPELHIEKKWPVVALRSRWTISLDDLLGKYRAEARDLVLMYTCDAQLYEYTYPQVVRSSRYRCPKEFIANAEDPFNYDLAEALRGKLVAYKITANAGFGVPDYSIETKIRIGLSRDGKTVFYHDSPDHITNHLIRRDYLVAFHLSDGLLRFEGRMFCVCTPRLLLKNEHMRRVALSGKYFASRFYQDLIEVRTGEEIDEYLDLVKTQYVRLDELAEKYRNHDPKLLP